MTTTMSTTMMMMKGKEMMLTMKMKCVCVSVWALLVSTKSFRQIEWMTSGMPEVVFNRRRGEAAAKAKADGKSLWRISSTVFGHLASDRWLEPVGHFATEAAKAEYPGMYVGDFVSKELESIALKSSDDLED